MNTKTLLPALIIAQVIIGACMVEAGTQDRQRGRSTPGAHDIELSFGFDCVAWQANAHFARRAPGTMGAWNATGTDPRGCVNAR